MGALDTSRGMGIPEAGEVIGGTGVAPAGDEEGAMTDAGGGLAPGGRGWAKFEIETASGTGGFGVTDLARYLGLDT